MATERPPGVASSASAKTLSRPVLAGRAMVRKAGPRPCNLPSMKRSNISDSSHVEIVPPGSTGWAKTPKPTAVGGDGDDDGQSGSVSNTWTAPPRLTDKPASSKSPAAAAAPAKKSDPKPAEPIQREDAPGPSSSSIIDNPFGIDINVTSSWAREVSPPPPTKRAWSDASPMDFSKPVVFEQPPASTTLSSSSSGARHTGPPPDNAWRPAVVRKPTVSSILKKPDSERYPTTSTTEPESSSQNQADPAATPAVSQRPTAPPVVDEAVQAMTMKQKAEEAMRRRQEQERLHAEQVRARLAEKLAALEKKSAVSKQISAPVSVMQRPKETDSTTTTATTTASTTTPNATTSASAPVRPAPSSSPPPAAAAAAAAATSASPAPTSANTDIKNNDHAAAAAGPSSEPSKVRTQAAVSMRASQSTSNANADRAGPGQGRQHSDRSSDRPREDQKASQSHRRDRRHGNRRHHDAPGSLPSETQSWTQPPSGSSVERDNGKQASDKSGAVTEGERQEAIPERESASQSVAAKDSARRGEDRSRRSAKTSAKNQHRQTGQEARPTDQSEPPIPEQPGPRPSSASYKSKSSHGHRKWRAKESSSPSSSPDHKPVSASPELDSDASAAVAPLQDKPTSEQPMASGPPPNRHVPRQWKSAPSDAQQPEADKKRHRPKRSGGRRPDPFRSVFENAPVVGSEAGTLMWSAAAPVIGSTGAVSSSGSLAAPRSWSTPKSPKSHNAQLLTQQQSRIKGSPGAALAARAIADTLAASRSN